MVLDGTGRVARAEQFADEAGAATRFDELTSDYLAGEASGA